MTKPAIEKTRITTTHSNKPSSHTSRDTTPRRTRNSRKAASDVHLSIDGFDVVALIDTGANYSVMSGSFASKLKKVSIRCDGPHIRTTGGRLVMPSGTCTSRVTIDGTTYPSPFVVLPNCSYDVIFGMDFFMDNGAVIDLQSKSITFSSDHSMTPQPNPAHRAAVRIAAGHVTLQPRASLMITVSCENTTPDIDAIAESNARLLLESGVSVAREIARLRAHQSHVLVANFTKGYQHSNKGVAIAFLEETQEASDVIAVADFERTREDTFTLPHPFDFNLALPQKQLNK